MDPLKTSKNLRRVYAVEEYLLLPWTLKPEVPGSSLSGCLYSMKLNRLHMAYPSLHPFGVICWVPVLSNIKTATGCESNKQLQLLTVFTATSKSTAFKDGPNTWIKYDVWLSSSKCLKKLFETHPSEVLLYLDEASIMIEWQHGVEFRQCIDS